VKNFNELNKIVIAIIEKIIAIIVIKKLLLLLLLLLLLRAFPFYSFAHAHDQRKALAHALRLARTQSGVKFVGRS